MHNYVTVVNVFIYPVHPYILNIIDIKTNYDVICYNCIQNYVLMQINIINNHININYNIIYSRTQHIWSP